MNLDPELGKAAFRIALFIIVLAGAMLIFLTPGTPRFAITVITLIIGLVFVGLIALLVHRFSR